jgi:hypothetical protein
MTLDYYPPQAYTKETLLKAYNWLQDQSEAVRDVATTPDQLVSLYLKAIRGASPESLERPSLQSFKSELKNLAGMMGDLEKKQKPSETPQPAAIAATMTAPPQTNVQAPVASVTAKTTLDELTQSLIREVKSELNLSSDQEALRMLVKIGYQKVKSLYK